uniref:Phospholipase A2 n=1 Tax=Acrobeloides nanus TaxID=290746 RepID=A0A914CJX0_9BILA
MAVCKLGYSAIAYNGYGCWCGVGGSGKPMDGIDTCCMYHDKCYDKAVADGACSNVPFEYINDYSWNCYLKEPNCTEPQDPCKQYLCWCDKIVVDCWGNYPPPQTKSSCVPHVNPVQKKKTFFEEAIVFRA